MMGDRVETAQNDGLETNESNPFDPEPSASLSLGLRVLFGLNGTTLALPTTALLYIVNTRASIPLKYLSAYGAVAFLPFSLKPLFAFLSESWQRNLLLLLLLALSGFAIAVTALIPKGGVIWCFILGFFRGITGAWPEFLLGLTLLDEAQATTHFESAAARFQSQAATYRNVGSLLANTLVFILFAHSDKLSDAVVNLLLVSTGALNFFGAAFAWFHSVGSQRTYSRVENQDVALFENPPCAEAQSPEPTESDGVEYNPQESEATGHTENQYGGYFKNWGLNSSFYGGAMLVITLQLMIVVLALKDPLTNAMSHKVWVLLLLSLFGIMLAIIAVTYKAWNLPHRVGVFLVAKHSMPTPSYLVLSLVYEFFQSSPALLQVLSLSGTAATTLSSWSYGRLLAKWSSGRPLLRVMGGTTIIYVVLSLLNIIIVQTRGKPELLAFPVVMLITLLTTFSSEWYFLPSVILATTSVSFDDPVPVPTHHLPADLAEENKMENSETFQDNQQRLPSERGKDSALSGAHMQYGTLVSCIDFGGQLGSWLTVPLVSALDISRKNEWANVDTFIVLSAILNLVPLALLPMLRSRDS